MTETTNFTEDEAQRFVARYGLSSLGPVDMGAMAEAMNKIAMAGLAVPRVISKFNAPAPIFNVPRQQK